MSAALFSKKPARSSGGEEKKAKPNTAAEVQHDVVKTSETEPRKSVLPEGEDSEAYRFILNPHITEKATNGNALNKYTFKVSKDSNKIEIKKAIGKLYKVKVSTVNIQKMPSKSRQVGRYMGTKSGFKKAIITLKEGQKIEVV